LDVMLDASVSGGASKKCEGLRSSTERIEKNIGVVGLWYLYELEVESVKLDLHDPIRIRTVVVSKSLGVVSSGCRAMW